MDKLSGTIALLILCTLISRLVIAHAEYRFGTAHSPPEFGVVSSHGLDSFRHPRAPQRPNLLFMTFHEPTSIPDETWAMFRWFSNGFDIVYADDQKCVQSLLPFGDAVVTRFHQLTGAHRADLWRYCMLYRFGGVYLDIKTVLTKPLTEMFPDEQACYTVVSHLDPATVYQGILSVPPLNSIMRDAIVNILIEPLPVKNYMNFCRQLFILIEMNVDGPLRIGRNRSRSGPDWVLWRERETQHCQAKDRYGYCQLVAEDDSGRVQCSIRDSRYPWKRGVQQGGTRDMNMRGVAVGRP